MVVSKNKEMRTWSGQNTHRVVRCRSSAKSPSPIIDMLLNRKSLPNKTREIKIWRWTERDFIVIDVGNGCVKEEMICNTCNKPHLQGKRVARARQKSRTCKANKSHVQGRQVYGCFMIQSLVKVILIFINCKMRFLWLLFVVYHSVIFLTEKLLKF